MNKRTVTKGLMSLLPLFIMHTASAATIDFNYTNLGVAGGSINDTVSMLSGGITVNVQAYSIINDGNGNISSTTLLSGGNGIYVSSSTTGNLGVVSSSTDGTNMDGGSSASDLDEGLLLTFDQVVSLSYINFDSFTSTGSDDFNLTVDGVSILVDFNANSTSPLVTNVPGQFDEYNFSNIAGTQILIWADGNSDSFRLDRIEVSAVPIPAAAWLFGTGLLALAGAGRRR